MHKPPVRTITLGLENAHPLTSGQITEAAGILENGRQRLNNAGYEVQDRAYFHAASSR